MVSERSGFIVVLFSLGHYLLQFVVCRILSLIYLYAYLFIVVHCCDLLFIVCSVFVYCSLLFIVVQCCSYALALLGLLRGRAQS